MVSTARNSERCCLTTMTSKMFNQRYRSKTAEDLIDELNDFISMERNESTGNFYRNVIPSWRKSNGIGDIRYNIPSILSVIFCSCDRYVLRLKQQTNLNSEIVKYKQLVQDDSFTREFGSDSEIIFRKNSSGSSTIFMRVT